MTTEATLLRHLQAIPQGADEIMKDYVEDSVLFTPDGPLHGLEAIKNFYAGFIKNSPPDLISSIKVTRQDIKEEVAYIIWEAAPYIRLASDTFFIKDGKIHAQSFAMFQP